MKKLAIVVLAVLSLSLTLVGVASAGGKWGVDNQKAALYPVGGGSSDNVLTSNPAQGKVIVVNPMGATTMVIQGEATGLTPGASYQVWVRDLQGYDGPRLYQYLPLGYFKLTTFVADGLGNGSFHVELAEDNLADGPYRIQVAINTGDEANQIGYTVLATPWNAGTDSLSVTLTSR